ncbi:uncharacterized protein LOC107325617 isoform X3 [Coturnix japonica]|uniref:uncharacterized protein LOC107325617 isoform X3 n=1 Tax=Coturnix japonica TaxID=93934 RepID=UPI000777F2B4|nr:uncharacterized protein LOC107325617 isoform X3 [Coturnix japonica]
MSYGLNIEMHKQTEIAKRLNVICAQLIPFLSQEHQQQVVQAVERAKQVTMSDLNAAIGHQLQTQHLSHHAPPIPLTPHPSGMQPPTLAGLGSASGLLALSGVLGGAQLLTKDDRGVHDAEHRERDPGPSSLVLPNGDRARAISEYLSSSKKRKVEEKDFVTDYGSDADKSEDNLVVDEDPASPHSVHSYSSRENGLEKLPLGRKEPAPLSPTSMASSSSASPSRTKDAPTVEKAGTPSLKSSTPTSQGDAVAPGSSSAPQFRPTAAKAPVDSLGWLRPSPTHARGGAGGWYASGDVGETCLLLPRQRRRADAAGPLSPRRPGWSRYPPARAAAAQPGPRRGGLRRHHQQLHAPRLHRGQRLRQGVGRGAAGHQDGRGTAGLLEPRQLHPLLQAAPRRPQPDRGGGGQHSVHLGPGGPHAPHQGRAHLLRPRLLRVGHQPRRQSLLLLLQRRQHRRVGPAEPDPGPAVPRPHGRCQLHRYLQRRHQAVDGGVGQHGALLGPAGRAAAAAARLHLPDLLPGALPDGRVAGSGHGEQQRGSAAPHQARQVPAAPARELRPLPQVRRLREVVCEHGEGQPAQRLAHPVWSQHLPVQGNLLRPQLRRLHRRSVHRHRLRGQESDGLRSHLLRAMELTAAIGVQSLRADGLTATGTDGRTPAQRSSSPGLGLLALGIPQCWDAAAAHRALPWDFLLVGLFIGWFVSKRGLGEPRGVSFVMAFFGGFYFVVVKAPGWAGWELLPPPPPAPPRAYLIIKPQQQRGALQDGGGSWGWGLLCTEPWGGEGISSPTLCTSRFPPPPHGALEDLSPPPQHTHTPHQPLFPCIFY